MRRSLRGLVVPFILSSQPLVFPAAAPAQFTDSVQASVRGRVQYGWTPGLVVGVVDASGAHFFSAGTVARRGGAAVDEHTVFEIGSVTKLFTTLLLTAMSARGEVRLSDPVASLLPDTVRVPERDSVITLRMLASHRSGLPDLPSDMVRTDSVNPHADYDAGRLYRFLRDYSLPRAAGSRFEYSNLGSGLLGLALARRAGMSYEEAVRARVLEPLGLRSTGITLSAESRRRSARGHSETGEAPAWRSDALAGAGALHSTASDLARFLGAVITRRSAIDSAIALTLPQPTSPATALGWTVVSQTGGTIVYAGGRTDGFRSFIGVNLPERRAVVTLTNSGMGVDDLGFHILTGSTPLTVVRAATVLAVDSLRGYVGEYQSADGRWLRVRLEGDLLVAHLEGMGHANIYHSATDEFFARLANVQISFVRDRTARVAGLTFYVNGRGTAARRVR